MKVGGIHWEKGWISRIDTLDAANNTIFPLLQNDWKSLKIKRVYKKKTSSLKLIDERDASGKLVRFLPCIFVKSRG